MRIVFVNKYYPPFNASTAHLLRDLASHLAREHEVHVITGAAPYVSDDACLRPPRSEILENVHVRRVWCLGSTRKSTLGRMADYLSFLAGAFLQVLLQQNTAVLVVMTTPPLLAIPGMIAARLKGCRLVLWNMDMYPDALAAHGMLRETNRTYRALSWLAGKGYRACGRIIALDQYMARRLENHGVPSTTIRVCSNWDRPVAGAEDRPARPAASMEFRGRTGAGSASVVFLYFGNLGLAQDTALLCAGMKRVVLNNERAVFAFVGGGKRFAEVEQFALREKLPRIHFTGYFRKEDMAVPLLAADVGLLMLKGSFNGVGTPSKTYSLLAAALPLLFVGAPDCEVADVIRKARCGVQVNEDDVDGFVRACEAYIADPAQRHADGQSALRSFQAQYEMSKVVPRLAQLVLSADA